MAIETLNDIIEEMADSLEIYGIPVPQDHEPDCKCRICFVSYMDDRIREAMRIESKINI